MTNEKSTYAIPTLNTAISDMDLLGIKLQEEITHLEKWMSSQQGSNRESSQAIVATIQGLIETRKNLLNTLEKQSSKQSQPDLAITTES